METLEIWSNFNDELYFFILKKVKDKNAANDIFQNTFLKIHKNISNLKTEKKIKAWIFQIARNETANYFNKESTYTKGNETITDTPPLEYLDICCFDKLVDELPHIYNEVIEMAYIKGQKQKDIAIELNISLENVKARIKRAKDMLKDKFKECCKYEFDKNNKLIGEPNCLKCPKE